MSNEKKPTALAQFCAAIKGRVPAPVLGSGAARNGGNGYPKGYLVWENASGFRTLVHTSWTEKAVTTFPGTLVDSADPFVTERADRGRLVGSVRLDPDEFAQHLEEMYTDTRALPKASRSTAARTSADVQAILAGW